MNACSGAWFRLKLIGDRYLALQPCLGSFRSIVSSLTERGLILKRPDWSCLVLSCLILQMSTDILKDIWEWFDVTNNNRQKKLFPHLVLQRRCILVRVRRGVKDVTVSGVWTTSGVKFSNSLSELPLIHTDEPTYSDRPKPRTDTAQRQSVLNSQHNTLRATS